VNGYVFGETDLVEEQQEAMQRCLDPITFTRLADLGVGPGLRCLDVGGGGGSVVNWLVRRVGATGSVLVTDIAPGEAFARFHRALCAVLEQVGADLEWGVHAHQTARDLGLVEVESVARADSWPGGGDGARWLDVNSRQLEGPLLRTGLVTTGDLDGVRAALGDPGFVASSYLMISTWGRRPHGGIPADGAVR
jgi:hypothetical protein